MAQTHSDRVIASRGLVPRQRAYHALEQTNNEKKAYLRLLVCTRMNSQSTMARTPVLNLNVSLLAARKPVGRNTGPSHPSNADRPMTSKLAMRSLLSALSISLPCLRLTLSILCWYHSSYSCRISATESDSGLSCLFASRRSGTPRICGAERTVSRVRPELRFSVFGRPRGW
jgi:hypothetical protein